VAMTVGRFLGTPVGERLGRHRLVRAGGLLAMAGVLLLIFSPSIPLSYFGALLWGFGVCLVFPAGVSAAGETPRPAESIAFVTTLGYGAILVGPPLIGRLADHVGLGHALLVLVVLAAIMAVLAPVVRTSGGGSSGRGDRDDAGVGADVDASAGQDGRGEVRRPADGQLGPHLAGRGVEGVEQPAVVVDDPDGSATHHR